jgi:hypothetical protein
MTIRSTFAANTCSTPAPGRWREMQVVRGSTLSIIARVASARRAQSGICAKHALALGDALWRLVQADSDDGDLDDFNPARLIAI